MKLLVMHLTRMEKGFICAAGVDVDTGKMVRAVTPQGRIPASALASEGRGIFDIARVVDLGPCERARCVAPHVEDFVFDTACARPLRKLPAAEFWGLLRANAKSKLLDIFGPDLRFVGPRSCGADPGKCVASLGLLVPSWPRAVVFTKQDEDRTHKIRMKISDGFFVGAEVGVTDIRLYGQDHVTPDLVRVRELSMHMQNAAFILSVGLTREYRGYHWLQVNNVHLEDAPAWGWSGELA